MPHLGLVVFSSVLAAASSLRRHSRKHDRALQYVAGEHDFSTCPVLSSLKHAGHLRPDSAGRISGPNVKSALKKTGGYDEVSGFQAIGIVGFDKSDVNQAERSQSLFSDWNVFLPYYVNLYTMNPMDLCGDSLWQTAAGYPCNINPQFQQHAFSTRIRDPSDGGTFEGRYADVFDQKGVLTEISGVKGRVMTENGLGKLLARARESGDHSGEFSLNASEGLSGSNCQKYHPDVSKLEDAKLLSQWQAIFAWGAYFSMLRQEKNGVAYVHEDDIKPMFLEGKFRSGWKKNSWGWETVLNLVVKWKGMGVGDEWIAACEQMLEDVICLPLIGCERQLFLKVGNAISGAKGEAERGNFVPSK